MQRECPICKKFFKTFPSLLKLYPEKCCSRKCKYALIATRVEERFWSHVDKNCPELGRCWLWTAQRSHGYGRFVFDGRGRPATHMSWKIHVRKVPDNLFLLHKCDNPPCVNPNHLYEGTAKQNMQDALQRGQYPLGERHGTSKVTEALVKEIRRRCEHEVQRRVAEELGLHESQVSRIVLRKNWRHIS